MTIQIPATAQIQNTWDALAPRFDEFTTEEWTLPFGERALRRVDLRPGIRFLDVGCGSGALAIPAARRGADVVAVDLASVMIERLAARALAEGLSNVELHVMDGASLELPDGTFDVSASQNGVTLLPDLKAALQEIVRVTKPGGRVLIVAFGALQKAECLRFLLGALRASVPGFTPLQLDLPPLPFRLADPSRFRRNLADAGLNDVQVDTVTCEMTFASAGHFWDVVTSGHPIAVQLASELTDEQRAEARQVLDGMFRERSGGGRQAVIHTEMNIGIGTK
jgi:ubiquinone/menaquinone biosynthesis C-methylase UbiE